jgi:hypothetical protein
MDSMDAFLIRIVSYFRKGSILKNEFNKVVFAMVETGQVIKADNDRTGRHRLSLVREGDTSNEYFVFTTTHLQVAFYTLILGHVLSFVVFLGEIACGKV